jgi:hypothetical protein
VRCRPPIPEWMRTSRAKGVAGAKPGDVQLSRVGLTDRIIVVGAVAHIALTRENRNGDRDDG